MGQNASVKQLANVVGERGERIFELVITDYENFNAPLFRPSFLGDRWPIVDYYVELLGIRMLSPFFFAQIKSTAKPIAQEADFLEISVPLDKCHALFRIPGPTYIVDIHEPSRRTFILSVHEKPIKGVYRIPLKYEMTTENLQALHTEVRAYWQAFPNKPMESKFK